MIHSPITTWLGRCDMDRLTALRASGAGADGICAGGTEAAFDPQPTPEPTQLERRCEQQPQNCGVEDGVDRKAGPDRNVGQNMATTFVVIVAPQHKRAGFRPRVENTLSIRR